MKFLRKLFSLAEGWSTPLREVKLAPQGSGFHYCFRCGDYNTGSFLTCPQCGQSRMHLLMFVHRFGVSCKGGGWACPAGVFRHILTRWTGFGFG